ncbi:CTP synthase [Microbacterium sp. NEAU-LLC]|uniref:CTP synthase (glutamine hydrolyzing) n=1 Tax=Microbacterium helvum TaxID=2773713 RepID=A0ABR8NU15_9MICO|nr:CTP synthase [Microbacterium helvum]MBD3943543.1 CTP synthase [Microbacterium helvum]
MHSAPLPTIALLGDDRGHTSHRELNALVPQLRDELGVRALWVPTDSSFDVTDFDGVWLTPGSPYQSDDAVYDALRIVREEEIPFLGTCGGMQYAVVSYLREVLGVTATHAESDGEADDNAVASLACSLYGEVRTVVPIAGTQFSTWCSEPFSGMHFCNYAPTAAAIAVLQSAGVVVGARAADAGAEVLEFPSETFFVTSMFQPHIGARAGAPIHPLIRAFSAAALATG